MPPRFNPFRQWLGVDSTNPNHYELLECDRTASNEEIRRCAQRQLARLKKVDPGGRVELLKKLTRRVKLAYQVLSDPDKRRAYDAKIDGSVQDALPAASETATFSQTGIYKADTTSTDLPLPLSSPTSESGPPAVATPVADDADDEIPMAVPVAEPEDVITATPVLAPPDPAVPVIHTRKPPAAIDVPGGRIADGGADDSLSGIAVKPTRRRRPNWIIPVVMVALFGIGVAGLVYFFLKYPSAGTNGTSTNTSTGPQRDNAPPTDDAATALGSTGNEVRLPGPLDPSRSDLSNGVEMGDAPDGRGGVESGDADESMADESNDGDESPNPPDMSDPDTPEPVANELDESMEVIDDDEPDVDESEDRPDGVVPSEVAVEPLSTGTRFLAGALVERARQAVFDRDYQRARSLAEQIRSMVQAPDGRAMDDQRSRWIAYADSIERTVERLEQFWVQVRASAIQNDGDIPFNDTRIAIVEADEDRVMVRAGENREFRYKELPAGLAMAIGESGEKENLPEWYIQKAAFYAANLRLDLKYRDRVREFMELARGDGYDVEFLETYLEAERASALEQLSDRDTVQRAELEQAVRQLAATLSLPEPLSRLSNPEVSRTMGDVFQWLLAQPELSAADAAAAAVWLSRLAAQLPDSEAAMNFNDIAASLARTDVARDRFELLQGMLSRNPGGEELERILRMAVEYLRSPLSAALRSRERREFVNQLRRAAEQVDSAELRRQVESLTR